jgi:hypothetical protein
LIELCIWQVIAAQTIGKQPQLLGLLEERIENENCEERKMFGEIPQL